MYLNEHIDWKKEIMQRVKQKNSKRHDHEIGDVTNPLSEAISPNKAFINTTDMSAF